MPVPTQDKKVPRPKIRLSKPAVRMALARRDWSQADLANAISKSLTAVNLTINHGLFSDVADLIRKELKL